MDPGVWGLVMAAAAWGAWWRADRWSKVPSSRPSGPVGPLLRISALLLGAAGALCLWR